ncbi:uncharacterized protein [Manis javanica]|uniref:uncharacterized protein n=1 Tax=Manis javanica TaxID=9974 RepID=UPI003C6CCB07
MAPPGVGGGQTLCVFSARSRLEGRGKARGCRKAGPVPSSQPVRRTPGTARPLPGAGSRLRPGLRRAPWGSRGAIAARRRGLLGAGSVGGGAPALRAPPGRCWDPRPRPPRGVRAQGPLPPRGALPQSALSCGALPGALPRSALSPSQGERQRGHPREAGRRRRRRSLRRGSRVPRARPPPRPNPARVKRFLPAWSGRRDLTPRWRTARTSMGSRRAVCPFCIPRFSWTYCLRNFSGILSADLAASKLGGQRIAVPGNRSALKRSQAEEQTHIHLCCLQLKALPRSASKGVQCWLLVLMILLSVR